MLLKSVVVPLLFLPFFAQSNEIALSFDDAPRRKTLLLQDQDRSEVLVASLKKTKVNQVIFFATTQGLYDLNRENRLLNYAKAGYLIGNHSHSHGRPDKLGIRKYVEDIAHADEILRKVKNFVMYFRYPFLDYGKNVFTRDQVRKGIEKLGYQNGYVTVDNSDWYMDHLVQQKLKNGYKVNLENLKEAYVFALWDSISFYDQLAQKLLGRSPKHVLLLHENDLAALFIDDLVKYIRSQGWKIISPVEAYADPIAKMNPNTLVNNNGRISAIAHERNYPGVKIDRFQKTKNIESFFEKKKVFY